ncbi:MAG: hypothetical protein O2894_11705 [Planctomycetota bacterium]|nr:hypothetical protein [Planctomycetota bacterium]
MRHCALLALLVLSTAAVVCAPAALAHGGNFREGGPQGPAQEDPTLPGERRAPAVVTVRDSWMPGDWNTWWQLNRGALLPDRFETRQRANAPTARP